MAVEPFLGTTPQRAFVGTIVLNAIIVLTLVAVAFGQVEANVDTGSQSTLKTIPCYLALFALAEIWELLIALDALKLRNIIQLAGILLFHIALIVMSAIQVHEAKTALVFLNDDPCTTFVGCSGSHTLWGHVEPLLIVVPIVLAVSFLVMAFYVKELFSEFGWAVFQVVGANPTMKTMYQWYQIEVCLLKFDFFFFAGVTMQMLILVLPSDSAEFGLTIAAIPIVFALLVLAGVAVRREIKWLMTISLILMLAAETYFIYKLVRFFQPQSEAEYVSTRASLTIFTIVAFLILFATFAVGLRCFSDFDQGLETAKMNDVPEKAAFSIPNTPGVGNERTSSYLGGAPLQQRLSIE